MPKFKEFVKGAAKKIKLFVETQEKEKDIRLERENVRLSKQIMVEKKRHAVQVQRGTLRELKEQSRAMQGGTSLMGSNMFGSSTPMDKDGKKKKTEFFF